MGGRSNGSGGQERERGVVCGARGGGVGRQEEREGTGRAPSGATSSHNIGGLGRLWARATWAIQRGKGGGQHGGVLRMSRHLDWRKGEARGGQERRVNGREHADMLQSAQMAGTRGFSSRPHAPTCVWQLQGGVNNVTMALDALGIHWSEEGG